MRPFGIGPTFSRKLPFAPGADEVPDQIARRLVAPIGDVESPRSVHRLARLERQAANLRVFVEVRGLAAGQILLEHLEVFAGERTAVMVRPNQGLRLELVDQR